MNPALDIAFVTYADLPGGDPDDGLALAELIKLGYRAAFIDWQDESFDYGCCGVVVLRSTWNYHKMPEAFRSWLLRVAERSRVINSCRLVNWNLSKKYLAELELKGISIVPTVFVDKAVGADEVESICSRLGPKIVVKPTLGLATHGVKLYDIGEFTDIAKCTDIANRTDIGKFSEIAKHINQLCSESSAMVQPFLESVETCGERSLIFIDGQFSHAVRKSAFQHLAVAGEAGEIAVVATEEEISFGGRVIDVLPESPLYARVDLLRSAEGQLLLLELELIEPSLFLALGEGAVQRFVEALVSQMAKKSSA